MVKQDPNAGQNWYVVHTYAGYEDAVKQALVQRVESMGMQDYIFDIQVPKEKQLTFRKGEPVEEEKKLFPGYVLVYMIVTDESWYLVRNTPNVTGFVGSGNIPVPVTPEEYGVIERRDRRRLTITSKRLGVQKGSRGTSYGSFPTRRAEKMFAASDILSVIGPAKSEKVSERMKGDERIGKC